MHRKFLFYILALLPEVTLCHALTYFLALSLLPHAYGSIKAAVFFGVDTLLLLLFAKSLGRWIDHIASIHRRVALDMIMHAALGVLLIAFFMMYAEVKTSWMIVLLIFSMIKFVALFENQLRVQFPVCFAKKHNMPLAQVLAVSNLATRGSHFFAPVLGLWLIKANHVIMIIILIQLLAVLAIYVLQQSLENKLEFTARTQTKLNYSETVTWWTNWHAQYLFWMNLAFGGMALSLSRRMVDTPAISMLQKTLQGPSPVYLGVVIVFLLIAFGTLNKQQRVYSFPVFFACLFLLSGLFAGAGLSASAQPGVLLLFGVFFGLAVNIASSMFQEAVHGPYFVEAQSIGLIAGRIGMLLSLGLIAGLLHYLATAQVLVLQGLLGMFASVMCLVKTLGHFKAQVDFGKSYS